MGIPYFARTLRTDDDLANMPLKRKLREQAANVVGGLKEGIRRRLVPRIPDVLEAAIYLAATRKLAGDYVEFGAFTGRTSIRAYHFFKRYTPRQQRRIIAFDSFEGLPPAEAADRVRYKDFNPGTMACSFEEYRRNCVRYGVPADIIVPVKGWYQDTCNTESAERIQLKTASVVMIDCDFYSSTYTALRFIGNYMEDGGVIVFDDWNSFQAHPQLGQRGAFARWVAENPQLTIVPVIDTPFGRAAFSVYKHLSREELEKLNS